MNSLHDIIQKGSIDENIDIQPVYC